MPPLAVRTRLCRQPAEVPDLDLRLVLLRVTGVGYALLYSSQQDGRRELLYFVLLFNDPVYCRLSG